MNKIKMKKESGFSLVEILVSIGVFSAIVSAVVGIFIVSQESVQIGRVKNRAVFLMNEYIEQVKNIRRDNWDALANNTYIIDSSGSNLQLTPSAVGQSVEIYTRSITVSDAYRDANGVLVESGGTVDPSTKKATVNISWGGVKPGSISDTIYLTRYLDNLAWTTDFLTGTLSNVTYENDAIRLSTNTKGKWCQPQLSQATIDLPQKPNAVWAEPYRVAVTSSNTSMSFANVLIDNGEVPSGYILGTLTGYAAYSVWSDTNYAYIATSNNSREVVIVDLNNFADQANHIYAQSGYFDTPRNSTDAQSVFVMQNVGYVAAGPYLYAFDLSGKNGGRPQIGKRIYFANYLVDKAGSIYGVTVGSSKYIFVGIEGYTPDEMKIINVTNPNGGSSQWGVVGGINIEPNNCSTLESGKSVYIKPDGTRAYISSTNDASFKEFFIIDSSNKNNPTLVGGFATNPPCTNGGGYDSGGMDPEQSVVVSLAENRAILVGNDATGDSVNSQEYQVLDITDEAHPFQCGGLDIDQGIQGVAAVKEPDGDAYAYIITGDSAKDLKIIQGGPDGLYVESGVYESATLDVGHPSSFNRLDVSFTEPANTSIQFQIAVVDPGPSGNCSDADFSLFNFVGPDGTSSSFFLDDGEIPINDDGSGYENPGRCMRLRATLSTTDYNTTPTFLDATVNYTP